MTGAAPLAFLAPVVAPQVAPLQPATVAASATQTATPSASSSAFCSGLVAGLVGAGATMTRKGRSQMAAGFDATKAMGAMPPTGYWDPCGVMKVRSGKDGFEWKDEETFNKYRVAELKHGRVAMIASVGLIANAFWKLPGFEDVPDGLAALTTSQGGAGFGILFILAGAIELNTPKGDFTDPAGLRMMCVDDDHVLASKELANCRMAMMAVVTLWVIEYGTGISPSSQLFNLELEGFVYPSIVAFLVALPLSGDAWKKAVNDPAWPFKEAPVAKTETIKMEVPKVEATEEVKVEEPAKATA